ncbi:MAG TPA: hypothetical protein VE439_02180, partial [Anaerolineae bacterium]|nr:hypothetical protein [Anaerolineae bacterium]
MDKDKLITELDDLLGWGTVATPVAVLLAFSPLNIDYFGLPKVTTLYLITLFLIYLQVKKWFTSGSIDIPIGSVLLPVGAVLVVAGVTALLSTNPLASLIGRSNRYESLLALICYATILW